MPDYNQYYGGPMWGAYASALQPQQWNPYTSQQMSNTVQQYSDQFLNKVAPSLNSQAILAGGYGGDRANLAMGEAAGETAKSLQQALTQQNLAGWNDAQGRNMQAGQMGLQGMTGLGGLSLQEQLGMGNLGLGWGRLGLDTGLGYGRLGLDTQLGMGQLANLEIDHD